MKSQKIKDHLDEFTTRCDNLDLKLKTINDTILSMHQTTNDNMVSDKGNKMLTLKEFMDLIDYKITEGSKYQWDCFGTNAYTLESWDGDSDGHGFSILFDTQTQVVYQVEAYDCKHNRAYRMVNADFSAAYTAECLHRGVNEKEAKLGFVDFVDLDGVDDFIQKGRAIRAGEDYDTRVEIQLDLDDDIVVQLMKMAHERDITFNQLVELKLQQALDKC